MIWLWVGLGGALGSMARHGVNQIVHQRTLSSTFPFGIFIVNIIGSAVIGLIAGGSARWGLPYPARTFLVVGVLGGFTTFSSFTLDTYALAMDGHLMQAVLNVTGQVALSLVMCAVGFRVGAWI
jgi:CrcB protein